MSSSAPDPLWVLCGIAAIYTLLTWRSRARRSVMLRGLFRRHLHGRMMDIARSQPRYMDCWGTYQTDSHEAENQFTYVNEIITSWKFLYEIGAMNDAALAGVAQEIFSGQPGRSFWAIAGPVRTGLARGRRSRRFHRLMNEAYQAALSTPLTPVLPPPTEDPQGQRAPGADAV